MNGACIPHEVGAGPRMTSEEFVRQHVAFEAVTRRAGGHHVAGMIRSAACERVDVVESGDFAVEPSRAVHAATSAVTQRGMFERAFEVAKPKLATAVFNRSPVPWCAWECHSENATSGHFTSPEKTTPRSGSDARAGCRVFGGDGAPASDRCRGHALSHRWSAVFAQDPWCIRLRSVSSVNRTPVLH